MRRAAALAALGAPLAAACAWLPLSLHPISEACPGPLAPVASLEPGLEFQATYRRTGPGGDEAVLLLVAERQGDELVLAALSPLGAHVFTVVQSDGEARVAEHVRPLHPHPPIDVLRDVHRAWRAGTAPGETQAIETPGCDYRALLTIH